MSPPIPPKPPARPDRASFWRYLRLMRRDILSAHPARLYRAWMAEFRTPFFRSYLCNDPEIVARVLKAPNREFPKSNRMAEGLRPLLGRSVFLTNGPEWERQRRIIDPAFEGGRLHESLPAMEAAACTAVARLAPRADGQPVEIEAETAHAAADAIFRTLFSIPIEDDLATAAFAAFRAHQATQPLVNLGAFLPLPRWVPRLHSARTRATARAIRA
ncbi:cytochrome P450, partial [Candidatus Falkowbacteria bacterium]|nr:cytochrome P450 [Candidatus Falkowbacteria bacterium]